MNIVLIGYRGTGKTTIARLLASAPDRRLVCLDEEVVKKAGLRIPEIVSRFGWVHFRDLESLVVEEFSQKDRLVIDAGGGVILRESNVAHLRKNGYLIWLTAPTDVIMERIRMGTERPSLQQGKTFLEEVEDVLIERLPLYRAAAHTVVDTAAASPNEIAKQIWRDLEKKGVLTPLTTK